ncbi:hypothetical protein ACJX0J_041796, partial [Zea mays]
NLFLYHFLEVRIYKLREHNGGSSFNFVSEFKQGLIYSVLPSFLQCFKVCSISQVRLGKGGSWSYTVYSGPSFILTLSEIMSLPASLMWGARCGSVQRYICSGVELLLCVTCKCGIHKEFSFNHRVRSSSSCPSSSLGFRILHCVSLLMRGDEAKRVCPGINLVQVPVARGKADLNLYRSAGAEVVAILASKGKCERASIDEVYLDLTDAAKETLLQAPPDSPEGIFMEAAKSKSWAFQLEKEKNFSTHCSYTVQMLAKLVSGMRKPAQQTVVPSSSVQDLLASLPVKKMYHVHEKITNFMAPEPMILFVSGVLLTIGSKPTLQFFTKPKDHKGSIFFGFGFFLVLIRWLALGIMVDSYGFIMLFKVCGCLLFRFSSAVIGWYTTTRTCTS